MESTAEKQQTNIRELVSKTRLIEKQVNEALEDAERADKELKRNAATYEEDLDKEFEMIKKHVEKIFKEKRDWLKKQQEKATTYSEGSIKSSKVILHGHKIKLQNAHKFSSQFLHDGSDCVDASLYARLKCVLEDLCEIQPAWVPENIEKIPTSKFTIIFPTSPSLDISFGPKVSSCSWELDVAFGDKDGHGKLYNPRGIAKTQEEYLLVANYCNSVPVKVYTSSGQFKFNVDQESNCAWNVAVSIPGNIYVSTRAGKHIGVFRSDGRYSSKFGTKLPTGMSPSADSIRLRGLTISDASEVLVGDAKHNYISIHNLTGAHITSFFIDVSPYYITTTSLGSIVVSPGYNSSKRHIKIFDSTGKPQQTITPPDSAPQWRPAGICCSLNDEISVSDDGDPKRVHCVASTGIYLGRITEEVKRPKGLVFLHNDSKLVVVNSGCEDSCVHIFCRMK